MALYTFTRSAKEDLLGIWLYTRETWGEAQADRYQDDLHRCCEQIANANVRANPVPGIDGANAFRCRHHYIFFVERRETIIIIAVLHERMDLIERLRDRL